MEWIIKVQYLPLLISSCGLGFIFVNPLDILCIRVPKYEYWGIFSKLNHDEKKKKSLEKK